MARQEPGGRWVRRDHGSQRESEMILFDRRNRAISDWRTWTRPKEDYQWRSSRSAMELARAWFTSPVPVTPPEIAALLGTQPRTSNVVFEQGWPELKTPLPVRGEGRNHDLVLVGQAAGQRLLVSIEAKVDETMGPAVGAYWRKSKNSKTPSLAWRRIDVLLAAGFGPSASATAAPWCGLPYQLLTALVGTAIEAAQRQAAIGVLAIHEFVTESATKERLERNSKDFATFLRALGVPRSRVGELYGPFDVDLKEESVVVQVFVGKAQYKWLKH